MVVTGHHNLIWLLFLMYIIINVNETNLFEINQDSTEVCPSSIAVLCTDSFFAHVHNSATDLTMDVLSMDLTQIHPRTGTILTMHCACFNNTGFMCI